jgi:hypothetical protein
MKFSDIKLEPPLTSTTIEDVGQVGYVNDELQTFFHSDPLKVKEMRLHFPLLEFTQRRGAVEEDDTDGALSHANGGEFVSWKLTEQLSSIQLDEADRAQKCSLPMYSPKRKLYEATVKNVKTGEERTTPLFLKFTHILDPHAVIRGGYPSPSGSQLCDPRMGKLQHKLAFVFNTAYVDSLASYIVSGLVHDSVCPHFAKVYGIYHGSAEKHCVEFTEEYGDYRHNRQFQQGLSRDCFAVLRQKDRPDCSSNSNSDSDTETDTESGSVDGDTVDNTHADSKQGSSVSTTNTNSEIDLDSLEVMEDLQTKYHSDDDAGEDGYMRHLELHNTPVQIVAMEAFELTMDSLLKKDYATLLGLARSAQSISGRPSTVAECASHWRWVAARRTFDKKWLAILMQTCMAMVSAQHKCNLVHNDLHTQNIMLCRTDHPYLYYKAYSTYYKVPTFGYIAKIIDMGRATFDIENTPFIGDVFKRHAEAGDQYTYPHGHYSAAKKSKNPVRPNKAFDLSRLSCSMLDDVFKRGDACYRKLMEGGESTTEGKNSHSALLNVLNEWITDKHGKPITRFQGFDLYKMLARRMACTAPLYQARRPHFKRYCVTKRVYNAGAAKSGGAAFHLTVGRKAAVIKPTRPRKAPAGTHHRAKKQWTFDDDGSDSCHTSDCSVSESDEEATANSNDEPTGTMSDIMDLKSIETLMGSF